MKIQKIFACGTEKGEIWLHSLLKFSKFSPAALKTTNVKLPVRESLPEKVVKSGIPDFRVTGNVSAGSLILDSHLLNI